MVDRADIVIVGGGLHGGLLAWLLLERHPEARLTLIERAARLGGNHTWCAFGSDIPRPLHARLAPLVAARWDGYEVRFPRLTRTIHNEYLALTSERLDAALGDRIAAAPNARLVTGREVTALAADGVTFADGRSIRAGLVVDARGPGPDTVGPRTGYQKFVGLEVRLAAPADVARPIVMDANVPQDEGYRFVYVLPFAADRLLVEDTFFADTAALDEEALVRDLHAYCSRQGWVVAEVLRRESGVLPMPWADAPTPDPAARPLVAGYRGGWFHPGTGYSLPWAVRVADAVASDWPADPAAALRPIARAHARQAPFPRALNFGLFRAVRPADRWRLFERFHRLPEDTIARFYPLRLTHADRVRLLAVNAPEVGALTGALRGLLR